MKKILAIMLGLMLSIVLVANTVAQEVDFYGMAQYRLRMRMHTDTFDTLDGSKASDYSNRFCYKFGAKVKPNDKLDMQFEIGNQFAMTEVVQYTNPYSNFSLFITQAWAKWNAGPVNLVIGLQPFKGSAVVDLFCASLRNGGPYSGAALSQWVLFSQNALPGFKVEVPILKDDTKLGINLFTTVLTERSITNPAAFPPTDSLYVKNPSEIMLAVDIPVAVGPLSLTPQLIMIMNNLFLDNVNIEAGSDMELIYGLKVGFKVNDNMSARLGFGMGSNGNANTSDTLTNPFDVLYKNSGMLLQVGVTAKAGPGKAIINFNFSTNKDAEDDQPDSTALSYIFLDAKYGISVNDNFTIMPRFRLFLSNASDDINAWSNYKSYMEMRPEILFIGKF